MRFKVIYLFIFTCILLGFWPTTVNAQELTRGVAENLEVVDPEIKGGDIVTLTPDGIKRASTTYDTKIKGIAVDKPIISIHEKTEKTRSIVTSGEVMIRVSAKNGGINIGDYITSSDIPGVGVKARDPGYVIGIARTAFTPNGSESVGGSSEEGMVLVTINIHFTATQANDLGSPIYRMFQAFTSNVEDKSKFSSIIRYAFGGLIALIVFLMSIILFGRAVKSGIDAIGRNPLARSSIQFGMMMNFVLAGFITFVGLFVAFMIIRF